MFEFELVSLFDYPKFSNDLTKSINFDNFVSPDYEFKNDEFLFNFAGFNKNDKWIFDIIEESHLGKVVKIEAISKEMGKKSVEFIVPKVYDLTKGKASIKDGLLKIKFDKSSNNEINIEIE